MPIPLGILAVAGAGAGGASSFDLLETTVLSSNAASVTFSNLNTNYSDYKHLQVRLTCRASGTSNEFLRIKLNGSNLIKRHILFGNGSSALSTGDAFLDFGPIENASNTANAFAAHVFDLLDAFSTNKNKTLRALGGSTTKTHIGLASGLLDSTSVLTSISFEPFNAANFVTGSRFSLYGVK